MPEAEEASRRDHDVDRGTNDGEARCKEHCGHREILKNKVKIIRHGMGAKWMCFCVGALKLIAVSKFSSTVKRKIALHRCRYMKASQIRSMQSNSPGENTQMTKSLKEQTLDAYISLPPSANCYLLFSQFGPFVGPTSNGSSKMGTMPAKRNLYLFAFLAQMPVQ